MNQTKRDNMLDDSQVWSTEPNLELVRRAYRLLQTDPVTALHDLEELAKDGSIMSMVYTGSTYYNGTQVPKDDAKAEFWLQRASQSGSLFATHELGKLYLKREELGKAAEYFSIGAEYHYSPSLFRMATLLLDGSGVNKDINRARLFLEMSANMGNLFAKRALAIALLKGDFGSREPLRGALMYILNIASSIRTAARDPDSPELRS